MFVSPPRSQPMLVSVGLALLALLPFHSLACAEPADPAIVTPGAMQTGSLLIKTDRGFIAAPRVKTDIDVVVSGPTARARVTQVFQNPTKHWIEGIYVYPLPDGGAVDTLKMVVGDRVVVADVAERQKARETYERARATGRKAALTEEERPNIFTNSVANLGPNETVVVQVEYQEPVHQNAGKFSLRVPLVVAPRYNPRPAISQQAEFSPGGTGWGVADPVPDRDRIEPPVADPTAGQDGNPVTVAVHLRAGFPLDTVGSTTHKVRVDATSADAREVVLDGLNQADRDFELTWSPAPSQAPSVGLFRERVGSDDYLLAYVMPPITPSTTAPRPRDVTFVIDNSGSMEGTSIAGARASLLYALNHLHPADRFNVIRFDDTMSVLFSDTVPADNEHLAQARRFVSDLRAAGGTEMLPPMKAALSDRHPDDTSHLRQIVFLTDGEIGNEQDIFDTIARMRGRTRLFMVGIGSAPNSYLMSRAAEVGRGSYTAISTVDQVQDKMQALVEKLESPAVTDLAVTASTSGADVTPAALPDLYRGEPLVLAARLNGEAGRAPGTLKVSGITEDRPWNVTLPIDRAAIGSGLSKVWARRKIDDAEVARTLHQISQDEADRTVLSLALTHHLVTRLTSLIAVDKTPSRPEGTPLTRADIPLLLPAGWNFESVFGPAGENGSVGPIIKADKGNDASDERASVEAVRFPTRAVRIATAAPMNAGVVLPKTATDAELRLMLGFVLITCGAFWLIFDRRGRKVPR